ncbi:unnamed protein product [Schistosoma spindalis]|nr:unnamed protein product [Schistosoma spindale]
MLHNNNNNSRLRNVINQPILLKIIFVHVVTVMTQKNINKQKSGFYVIFIIIYLLNHVSFSLLVYSKIIINWNDDDLLVQSVVV